MENFEKDSIILDASKSFVRFCRIRLAPLTDMLNVALSYLHVCLVASHNVSGYAQQALAGAPAPHGDQVVGEAAERRDQIRLHHANGLIADHVGICWTNLLLPIHYLYYSHLSKTWLLYLRFC